MMPVLAVPVAVYAGILLFTHPSNDRNWKPEHRRMPVAVFDGNLVHVGDVRDFRYVSADSSLPRWYDRTYDLDRIATLWYVLAVFHPEESRGPAHGMLSFGFDDGSYVVISVEARKEVGESYSTWLGLCHKYEILYVVGDERDLILTRAVYRSDEVYLYPVRTTREKIRALFVDMLRKANDLREHPEFYNTLTDNCTSKLRDHVNAISPGRVPSTWRVVLPGYSDVLLENLGLLDSSLDLEQARRRFRINDRARAAAGRSDFSTRIRAAG